MNIRILSMNERGWRTGGRAAVVSNTKKKIFQE